MMQSRWFVWMLLGCFGLVGGCINVVPIGNSEPDPVVQEEAPVVDSVVPAVVSSTGGTEIVIKGKCFTADMKVYFGTEFAPHMEWKSAEEMHIRVPSLMGKQGNLPVQFEQNGKMYTSGAHLTVYTANLAFATDKQRTPTQEGTHFVSLQMPTHTGSTLLVFGGKSLSNRWFLWDNDTKSFIDALLPNVQGEVSAVATVDWNGDGWQDVVIATTQSELLFLLQDGKGGFLNARVRKLPQAAQWIRVGDVNQDGRTDLILLMGTKIATWLNDEQGEGMLTKTSYAGDTISEVGVGFSNEDAYPDVVVLSKNSLSVLINNTDGTFQIPSDLNVGAPVYGMATADINADGLPELVMSTLSHEGAFLQVWKGASSGWKASETWAVSSAFDRLLLADVDGDKHLDILASDSANDTVALFRGGNEQFSVAPWSIPVFQSTQQLAVADINGDQKPELLLFHNTTPSRIRILWNESQ